MTIKELSIQDTAQGLGLSDNLIGRDDRGNKYYLTVEIKPVQREAHDIDHKLVSNVPVISMSGTVLSKYGSITSERGWISAGQCLDSFDNITQFTNRWSLAELQDIIAIWRGYHFNDMQTHCTHQDKSVKWDEVKPCTITGYRAGSAWLYSPIPDSVLVELTGIILKHKRDGEPTAYDYEVQGYYTGHGWETLTTEQTRGEALLRVKEYRANERGLTGLRIKRIKAQEVAGGWSL
jgi:hypothetical protein